MMSCQRASVLMSQKMDRPLSRSERISLRFHLLMCSGCRRFDRQMGSLRQLSKAYCKDASASPKNKNEE